MLTITFISLPVVDDTIEFKYYPDFPSMAVPFVRNSRFKAVRVNPGEVTIGTTLNSQASFYAAAFELDYGTSFSVEVAANVVTIEALNGSPIIDFLAGPFVDYVLTKKYNTIHIINFSPKRYSVPAQLLRNYLITEDSNLLITEDGKKIRL